MPQPKHQQVSMAGEGRLKSPSLLGMAGEERHKSLLAIVLNVCTIGRAVSALPMTPSTSVSQEILLMAEAFGLSASPSACTVGHSIATVRVFWQCTPQTVA